MELRVLRYFWTVAQEKNISRAAKILHITQPTLSRQIKGLEDELGTILFNRESQELTLTEDGLFLQERAGEILLLSEQTQRSFQEKKDQLLNGHFSIGCVEADNSDTLAMMLEELVSDYPQVSFNIVSTTSEEIVTKLDKGLLDLALLLEPVQMKEYETLVLPREERWGLLVSPDSFLAQKKRIEPQDLKGIPLLSSSRNEIQTMIAEWMGVSWESLNIVGTYNLIFNVFSLVENRVGSALTIEGATTNRDVSRTAFIPLYPELKTRGMLVWKKNRIHTPVTKELIKRFRYAFEA
ncbi:transcriptional regulator [Enterococcus sp. JM4C]|uniref:LysR family transcriptional regulator n=1 Tax=Candidatus Enterococcus huntleyi TaxID=1857217 RepID=UPI00137A46D0|nr:LysR family transcriptional regulator [Enterococcus sp. JM4C]KAF1299464.1 transcriptional regulator [Enterococcus sp. JM4C]